MFFSAIDAIDISPLLLFQNEVYFQSTESGSSEFRNFVLGSISQSVNQSIKIYFSSNEKQLQYNECYSTWKSWKATREAFRSLKLVAWTKKQHKY